MSVKGHMQTPSSIPDNSGCHARTGVSTPIQRDNYINVDLLNPIKHSLPNQNGHLMLFVKASFKSSTYLSFLFESVELVLQFALDNGRRQGHCKMSIACYT